MSDLSMVPSNNFFAVSGWPRGRTWLIELNGELDISSRPALERTFARAAATPSRTVVIDGRGVTFIDGGGLDALLSTAAECDREVWLRAPSLAVLRIAHLVGLELDLDAIGAGEDVRLP